MNTLEFPQHLRYSRLGCIRLLRISHLPSAQQYHQGQDFSPSHCVHLPPFHKKKLGQGRPLPTDVIVGDRITTEQGLRPSPLLGLCFLEGIALRASALVPTEQEERPCRSCAFSPGSTISILLYSPLLRQPRSSHHPPEWGAASQTPARLSTCTHQNTLQEKNSTAHAILPNKPTKN